MFFNRFWTTNSVFLLVTALSFVTFNCLAGTDPRLYNLYRVQNGVEFWLTNTNRCDETKLSEEISTSEADRAIDNYFLVSPKFDLVLKKIESVNITQGNLIRQRLQRLTVFFDPADSVVCGGEVKLNWIDSQERPSLYLSLSGASAISWNTVVPHELAHLAFAFLGISSSGLEESWADLLAISVNNYRPYLGESDGTRALILKKQKLNDPNTSERSKTIYKNWCASAKAFRDFSFNSSLKNSYLDLEDHNTSCYFVKAFLDSTKSLPEERDNLLYNYLFSTSYKNRRYYYSSNYSKTLSELLKKNKLLIPTEAKTDYKSSLQTQYFYDDRLVTVEFSLSNKFIADNTKNSRQPLAFEVQGNEGHPIFRWISNSFSSGKRELSKIENCDFLERSLKDVCACFNSEKIIGQITFLNKAGNLSSALSTTKIKPGCYVSPID